jgi:hypothetical protein
MEEQPLSTEDDVVAENTSTSNFSLKEQTVSEESQSFSTLKNKFEGIVSSVLFMNALTIKLNM